MENEEDILNVEFDPSELDNIDEDALLSETISETVQDIPSHSFKPSNVAAGNAAEFTVTSSVEFKEMDVIQAEPSPKEVPSTENLITSTESDDRIEAKPTEPDRPNSSDEDDVKKSTHDKFNVEDSQIGAKKCAVSRDNIPDSLDDVKLPGQPLRMFPTNKGAQRFYSTEYKRDYRNEVGVVERVFVNPHFKGSLGLDQSPTKMTWTSQANGGKSSQSSLLTSTSLLQPVCTLISPSAAPSTRLTAPPPTYPLIPFVLRPITSSGSASPLSQAFLSQRLAAPLFQSPNITKQLIDTSRPPPPLLNVALMPEKSEWLGATEDFLKKIQTRETHSFDRPVSNRYAADHIRRKYGVNHSRHDRRRRSSASSAKSYGIDTKKREEKTTESILAKHGDICDENYLKMLEQQRLNRENYLKRKELRRQMEISNKKIMASETTKLAADRPNASEQSSKGPVGSTGNQAQKSSNVKERIVLRASANITSSDEKKIGQKNEHKLKHEQNRRIDIVSLPNNASTAAASSRRVVLPPGTSKKLSANQIQANLRPSRASDGGGRNILRSNVNKSSEKSSNVTKRLGKDRRIALWTSKRRGK